MIMRIIKIILLFIFLPNNLSANTQFFQQGLNLFNNKKFKQAKFKFEQDLVIILKVKCLIYIYPKFLEI